MKLRLKILIRELIQKNIIKVDDEKFLKYLYKSTFHKELNLENPSTFNEKLQWLKLYDRNPEYIKMVDKYEAKKYVADIIGEEYIIPTLGVWDKFDEIDFSKLPNQFVIKCTHDSGGVVICEDKNKLNLRKTKRKIEKCLKQNFYYRAREWPYKNVKPRIIVEKYMVDESKKELKDYKVFCFNGEPKFIEVDFDRFIDHKRNIYTTNWELMQLQIKYPMDSNVKIKKPEKLEEMIKFARILAKNIPHVRVDFYSINKNIYFGELTFYHESGFGEITPEEWNKKLGDMIILPKKSEK